MSVETTKQGELRANAVGLPGVLFQSVTTMAPAGAVAFALGAGIPYTGGALPLAVIISLLVCVLVALSIGSLAKYLPSAGSYATYVGHALGPQVGWLTGWLFSFTYVFIVAAPLFILAQVTDTFFSGTLHLSFGPNGWVVWAIAYMVLVFCLTYFGIRISADAGIILGAIEITIFVVLALWLIVATGGNNTLAVFNPGISLEHGLGGWQGILHGMIFTFLAFAGFEAAAPLAEESRHPRRTVPRAILLAVVIIGVFYAFCAYAGVNAWGINKIIDYPNNPNPWGALAARVWGPFAFIAVLAIINSDVANENAGVNVLSRMLFAFGRIRTLPAVLGQTNRFATPGVSVIVSVVLGTVLTIWLGLVYGVTTAYALVGALLTIPLLVVYMLTCVAVPVYYLREHRDEFNLLRHVLVPAIPFIVLAVVVYFQFVPAPPAPINLAGPISAAWLVLGIVIVAILNWRAPKALALTNAIYTESQEVDSGSQDEVAPATEAQREE